MEVYRPREVSQFLFLIKFLVGCPYNHVWEPIFDPSYDHIYKNIHLCKRLTWVTTTVEKSVNNYVEWYFQSTERFDVS